LIASREGSSLGWLGPVPHPLLCKEFDEECDRVAHCPFAIVPPVMLAAGNRKMGALIVPRRLTALAAITAVTVITLNLKLLYNFFTAF
jgi:hypothetical protein